jgi:hypothetical protein
MATTIAWFFSKYHKTNFDQGELRAAMGTYLQSAVSPKRRPASVTLRNDISVLTRLYGKTQSAVVVEDALDSPLCELGLIVEDSKGSYSSVFEDRPEVPCEILGFAIWELMKQRGSNIISIEELIYSAENFVSPASVFRLTESAFMAKLEELARYYSQYFTLQETAGLRQMFLENLLGSEEILKIYYKNSRGVEVGDAA